MGSSPTRPTNNARLEKWHTRYVQTVELRVRVPDCAPEYTRMVELGRHARLRCWFFGVQVQVLFRVPNCRCSQEVRQEASTLPARVRSPPPAPSRNLRSEGREWCFEHCRELLSSRTSNGVRSPDQFAGRGWLVRVRSFVKREVSVRFRLPVPKFNMEHLPSGKASDCRSEKAGSIPVCSAICTRILRVYEARAR